MSFRNKAPSREILITDWKNSLGFVSIRKIFSEEYLPQAVFTGIFPLTLFLMLVPSVNVTHERESVRFLLFAVVVDLQRDTFSPFRGILLVWRTGFGSNLYISSGEM
jgi:hypothetical protein